MISQLPVSSRYLHSNDSNHPVKKNPRLNYNISNYTQLSGYKNYASLKASILFKGTKDFSKSNAKPLEETKLYNSYKEAENNGRGIYEFISTTEVKPEDAREFLNSVLKERHTANRFIDEITKDPRQSRKIVKKLTQKLGGKNEFFEWYYGKNGYADAYDKYNYEVFKKADTIEELLKRSPNWGMWKLSEKYGSKNFVIGEVPAEFKDKQTFRDLVRQIKKNPWFDRGAEDFYVNNKKFNIYRYKGAGDLSNKNIYRVKTDGKTFILKTDRFYPEDLLKKVPDSDLSDTERYTKRYNYDTIKEGKALKGDSLYLDACIDYYLHANKCQNSINMYFYDYDTDASLYEFVNGNEIGEGVANLLDINGKGKDINALGIYLNDAKESNFIMSDNDELKMIDIGHASFIDPLRPGSKYNNIELSNQSGASLTTGAAGIMLADSCLN